MNRFPWFEALLIAALAVALIVKQPSRVVSAASRPDWNDWRAMSRNDVRKR